VTGLPWGESRLISGEHRPPHFWPHWARAQYRQVLTPCIWFSMPPVRPIDNYLLNLLPSASRQPDAAPTTSATEDFEACKASSASSASSRHAGRLQSGLRHAILREAESWC